jgi:hypothetical protein
MKPPFATPDPTEPFPEDELDAYHSPEPWRQDGRYIRDASGTIVVRGRTIADARRIVAAINATRDMPTDALEGWLVQDVSDPHTRPNLEVAIEETPSSRFAVPPPEARPVVVERPAAPVQSSMGFDRRRTDRRERDRRGAVSVLDPQALVFDRRVMERRLGQRRAS